MTKLDRTPRELSDWRIPAESGAVTVTPARGPPAGKMSLEQPPELVVMRQARKETETRHQILFPLPNHPSPTKCGRFELSISTQTGFPPKVYSVQNIDS